MKHFSLKNGSVFVLAEAAGGVYNADQMRLICQIVEEQSAVLKLTEDHRIGFMAAPEKLPEIQKRLGKSGILVRSYRENSAPAPKACLGELCPLKEQDALSDAIDLTAVFQKTFGNEKPFVSIGINGCQSACIASATDDIHIVGESSGYKISIGGKASEIPQIGQFLAENVSKEQLATVLTDVMNVFFENRNEDERLYDVIERIGMSTFMAVVDGDVQAPASASRADAESETTLSESVELSADDLTMEDSDLELESEHGADASAGLDVSIEDESAPLSAAPESEFSMDLNDPESLPPMEPDAPESAVPEALADEAEMEQAAESLPPLEMDEAPESLPPLEMEEAPDSLPPLEMDDAPDSLPPLEMDDATESLPPLEAADESDAHPAMEDEAADSLPPLEMDDAPDSLPPLDFESDAIAAAPKAKSALLETEDEDEFMDMAPLSAPPSSHNENSKELLRSAAAEMDDDEEFEVEEATAEDVDSMTRTIRSEVELEEQLSSKPKHHDVPSLKKKDPLAQRAPVPPPKPMTKSSSVPHGRLGLKLSGNQFLLHLPNNVELNIPVRSVPVDGVFEMEIGDDLVRLERKGNMLALEFGEFSMSLPLPADIDSAA